MDNEGRKIKESFGFRRKKTHYALTVLLPVGEKERGEGGGGGGTNMPSDLMPLVTIWRRAGECLGQGWKRRLTAVEGYVLQGTASAFDRGCVSCGITKGGEQQRWEGRGGGEERKKKANTPPVSVASLKGRPWGGQMLPKNGSSRPLYWTSVRYIPQPRITQRSNQGENQNPFGSTTRRGSKPSRRT